METLQNNVFFNSLFTSDEFNFIKNIDSDNILFDKDLEILQNNRDLIVNLINELKDAIYFSHVNQENCEVEETLLSKTQKIFELINNNISILQLNKKLSDSINEEVMNLLIKVESDGNNVEQSKYINDISNLKNQISTFSGKSDAIKKTIATDRISIDNFFNDELVKHFLNKFSIKTDSNKINTDSKPATDKETNKVVVEDVKEDNNCLLVSETAKKVFLPYSKKEILEYLEKYPNQYTSFADVVQQEFIYPIDYYLRHPAFSRFRETYTLIRDREAKSVLEAFKVSMDVMFHYDLNPAIIAACKSQEQLENYLKCLSEKNLNAFKDFEIRFEIAPFKVNNKKINNCDF